MYRWRYCAVLFVALAGAGCQPHPLADASWPDARPLGDRLDVYRPSSDPDRVGDANPSDFPDPTGDLTLRQAMALTVARNPSLRAFAWEVRRAEANALQAGLWPNPELEVELENFAGNDAFSGTQSLETTISLAQTFPLGGDLQRRRELAGYDTQLAGWDYEAARLDVLTEATQRYIHLLAAQRRVEAAADALQLAEQLRQAAGKRIDAGVAPQVERARASVPAVLATVSLRRAQRELDIARKMLAMMWASHTPTFVTATGSLDDLPPPPNPDRLVSLINQNPDVARWAVEISARQAAVKQAEAEAVPDLTVRLGYKYDRGEEAGALVAGIALPLPIFDRRQGDVLAARIGASTARHRQREAELRLEATLSLAYLRFISAYDEAVAIRDEALPAASEAFEVTHAAFEKGDLTFIDVLDAERTLVELRNGYLEALVNYHTAAAEIEGLIGTPLDSLHDTNHTMESEQDGVEQP